jgi:hypothetical protein
MNTTEGRSLHSEVKAGKSSPNILNPTTPTPAPQITQPPIEEISDLLDTRPIDACVELTGRLLTAAPTLPSGAACSRAAPEGRLETQFQPVNDPSDSAVIEKVAEALQAYSYVPASGLN